MRNFQSVGTSLLGIGLGLSLVTGCDSPPSEDTDRSCQGDNCVNDGVDEPAILPVDNGECGPHQTDLIAGQHNNTGSVNVSNDGNSVTIGVQAAGPYQLTEVHIYVGTGPVPNNGGNGVSPGQFPYGVEFDAPVGDYQLEVPLAELAASCGDGLTIAVHAVVVAMGGGDLMMYEETAWGFGPDSFDNSWGWSFEHELCCDGGDGPGDEPIDEDGDGVPAEFDCDDNNPAIGALLYENNFDDDDGYLALGPKLTDPWWFDGEAHTTKGGQQALLGQAETWGNTVTFGTLRVSAVERKCGNACPEDNTRFRAGFLSRTTENINQDEGYHGYRCAVARNSGKDCYDPGPFVQLAAFLDGEEDDINSECIVGCAPNPTFDQLDRQERSEGTNFINGDSGSLVFWSVDQDLVCEFYGNDNEHVVARAVDDRFDTGTTGLSTLNALADFAHVRVCEAFEAP